MRDVVVVVPCYNEAERLDGAAFQDFVRAHEGARLLFVDDGSRDGTAALLAELCAAAPALGVAPCCGAGTAPPSCGCHTLFRNSRWRAGRASECSA